MKELISFRKLNSKTYDLENGQKRCIHQQGMHYYDLLLGRFEPCNTDLVAGSFANSFTHDVNKSQLPFRIDSATGKRRFYPVVGDKTKWIEEGGFAGLTNSQISGKQLSFSNTNYDTQFITKPEGCKLQIILKNKDAPSSFSFPITLNKLTWDDWKIKDGNTIVARLDKGFAYDSSGIPIYKNLTAEYSNGTVSFSLDTKDMVYPITIDPNVVIQPSDGDTYLDIGASTTNFGSTGSMRWQREIGHASAQAIIAYFDFSSDVAGGSTIDAATLSLYVWNEGVAPAGRKIFRLTNTSWTEGGATWDTYDGVNNWAGGGSFSTSDFTTDDVATTVTDGTDGISVDWNVQAQVQAALDSVSGVYHFVGTDGTGSGYTDTIQVRTKEHGTAAQRPKLDITFTPGGATVTHYALSKARIKKADITNYALSQLRVKVPGINNFALATLRIKNLAITNYALAKTRIKKLAITNYALARVRILKSATNYALSRARIKIVDTTNHALSTLRVKILSITNHALSKTRIKKLGIVNHALSRVAIIVTKTYYALSKLRIKKLSVSNYSLSRLRIASITTVGLLKLEKDYLNKMNKDPDEFQSGRLGRFTQQSR